jgi:hypothetical protein
MGRPVAAADRSPQALAGIGRMRFVTAVPYTGTPRVGFGAEGIPSVTPPTDDIRCNDDEGRRYRDGVYSPLDERMLAPAPPDRRFPSAGHGPAFLIHDTVPRVPRLRHVIGPSVIALGMGVGAGEFLLWPNLVAANGYSIWWLFLVGVLTQFGVLVEIERWTLCTGESIFAGMARLDRWSFWPWLFLVATLTSFFWPGWASQSAEFTRKVIVAVNGPDLPWQPIALAMMLLIWCGLSFSKVVYNALEKAEMLLVLTFFPLLALSLLIVGLSASDVAALAKGAVSIGTVPASLITGGQFPTLVIAVAYAGTGGALLLAQSLWIRDKGFGMAAYQGRVTGVRGANERISATGYVFDGERSPLSLARIRAWLRVARHELFVTFVLLTILCVIISTLLIGATLGTGDESISGNLTRMVTLEADALARAGGSWLKVTFLLSGVLALFSTQLGIVDTVTRLIGTIFYERFGRRTRFWTQRYSFLAMLNIFVVASMAIIAASWKGGGGLGALQPDFLVLIAGPFTITSMYVFTLVIGYMNASRLPSRLATPRWGRVALLWCAILWGWFTVEQLSRLLLGRLAVPQAVIEALVWHPARGVLYAVWLVSLAWFAWILFRSRAGGKPRLSPPSPTRPASG